MSNIFYDTGLPVHLKVLDSLAVKVALVKKQGKLQGSMHVSQT